MFHVKHFLFLFQNTVEKEKRLLYNKGIENRFANTGGLHIGKGDSNI